MIYQVLYNLPVILIKFCLLRNLRQDTSLLRPLHPTQINFCSCFNNLQNANFAWVTNRITHFRFPQIRTQIQTNPISYTLLYSSIIFVAQFTINSNPSFLLSKPNICLASQIIQNIKYECDDNDPYLSHSKRMLPSVKCLCVIYRSSVKCLCVVYRSSVEASIVLSALEIWETLINGSTNWPYAQSSRIGHPTHVLDAY